MSLLQAESSGGQMASVGVGQGPDPVVWLCLLGGFRLIRGGQPVPIRSGGKTEGLLARLGLAGFRGLPREALLRSLWPYVDPSLAGQSLNSVVHRLRILLGEALGGAELVLPTAGQYRLNTAAGIAVDVTQFRELVAEGERLERLSQLSAAAPLFERAAELYGGDLSLAAGNGGAAILERERLRATYRRVLIRLADSAFANNAFDESLGHALALLAHDPWREDAHRLVMRCHVRLGERAQALRHYQTVQDILRVELDAEPEPATSALFQQIRRNPGAV